MGRSYLLVPSAHWAQPSALENLDAAQVEAYCSLWHPELLIDLDSLPWLRDAGDAPSDAEALAISQSTLESLSATARTDLIEQKDRTIVAMPDVDAALLYPPAAARSDELSELDGQELRRDFCALGFAYLGLKVVYAQMERDDPLDVQSFLECVQNAACAFVDGEREALETALAGCFDALHNARMSAYPATINLVDLALLPPNLSPSGIEDRLAAAQPFNLLATGAELESLAARLPAAMEALARGVQDNHCEVLGSPFDDRPPSVLAAGSILWQYAESARVQEKWLQRTADTFGSRVGRLGPDLPQLLSKLGFRYGLHAAFDGSRLPQFREPKIHWNAADLTPLECLCRVARNGARNDRPLGFFAELGQAVMKDRSATVVVARWLEQSSRWLNQVFRIHRRSPVFGKFDSMADFFISSSLPDGPTRTYMDEYESQWSRLCTDDPAACPDQFVEPLECRSRLDRGMAEAALQTIASGNAASEWTAMESELEREGRLPNGLDAAESLTRTQWTNLILRESDRDGWLAINPSGVARRGWIVLPQPVDEGQVAVEGPVKAVQAVAEGLAVVVDVPGWGFVWIPKENSAVGKPRAATSSPGSLMAKLRQRPQEGGLAGGRRLANEFIEAEIDGRSGGLRGVWSARSGYSRLGQQICHSNGSTSKCEKIEVVSAGPAVGEIKVAGKVLARDGKLLAAFTQRYRLLAAKPTLEIDLELTSICDELQAPGQYLASRWAWPDDKAKLSVADAFSLQRHRRGDFETPWLFELRERNLSTAVFTHGLPFHRRVGSRMADTLLVAWGSKRRRFRFSIGLDLGHWWATLDDLTMPLVVTSATKQSLEMGRTGWLVRQSATNVRCFQMRPVAAEQPTVRFGFVEAQGVAVRSTLRFCRNPTTARLVNAKGDLQFELYVDGDSVNIDFSAHELLFVEVVF